MLSAMDTRSSARMILWTRLCIGAICAIMIAAFLFSIYDGRRNIEKEAAAEAQHQARLLSDQISRALRSLDQALNIISGRVQSNGMAFFAGPQGSQLLVDMARAVPLDTSFWVFHPNGVALAASIDTKGGTVRITDRDYYKKLLEKTADEVVIGAPVTGKVSGAVILPIARGVRNDRGGMVAIVSTSLRLTSVDEAYRGFLGSGENTIELKRIGTEETIFRIGTPPKDTAEGDRIQASEPIQGYPLLSTAGVHVRPWKDRWKREVMLHGSWLAVGLFLTVLLYWTVVREARVLGKNAVLLTEVHHRVKNNLSIIQSLLMLESNRAPPEARQGYKDSVARIEAMGLVHHLIYDHQRFEGIVLDHYLPRLCSAICRSADGLQITIDSDPIEVPLDTAVPLALIMNEVINNSLKHARLPEVASRIGVTLRCRPKDVLLTIEDNGPGLPDEVIKGNTASLGLQIVRELTRQINGTCWFENGDGARFKLLFDPPQGKAAAPTQATEQPA